jgi:hypothetical protein
MLEKALWFENHGTNVCIDILFADINHGKAVKVTGIYYGSPTRNVGSRNFSVTSMLHSQRKVVTYKKVHQHQTVASRRKRSRKIGYRTT